VIQLIDILLGLICVLVAITVVGHGIWVVLASLRRSLAPIDRDTAEIKKLATTQRVLEDFVRAGALDEASFRTVQRCIDLQRQKLGRVLPLPVPERAVPKAAPPAQKSAVDAIPIAEPALPIREQFEKVLETYADVRELAAQQSRSLIDWARDVGEIRCAALSFKAQLGLARLLKAAGQSDDALRAYRRLLRSHPSCTEFGELALEAARLAIESGTVEQAQTFLEDSLTGSLSLDQRREAECLLAQTRPESVEAVAASGPQATASTPLASPRPQAPRRSLAEVLAAFMEERNILWGELIGGLLVVGGSVALVVSLWKTLEEIEYSPFLIFSAITAAIFAAGLYTLHHWKLESTSRGLLFIGMLLVPLDFLVMAGLLVDHAGEVSLARVAYRLTTEAVTIAVFAFLMNRAARVLLADGSWLLVTAVLGAATSPLAIHWLQKHTDNGVWPIVLLGMWPVACYCGSVGSIVFRVVRRAPFDDRQAISLFSFLGIATFPVVIAMGFLVYWSADIPIALTRLAVPIALAGIPILTAGFLVHVGLTGPTSLEGSSWRAALRTAGTAVALVGMLVMLLAVLFAWPQPVPLLIVCVLNFAVLTTLAFTWDFPAAHAPALACLIAGYLTGIHYFSGNLQVADDQLSFRIWEMALSALSGRALVVLVGVMTAVAIALKRRGRQVHARLYGISAAVAEVISLVLVHLHAHENPATAAAVCATYALGTLAVNVELRQPGLTWAASALILGTCWHVLTSPLGGMNLPAPVLAALLLHATFVTVAGCLIAAGDRTRSFRDVFPRPFVTSGLFSSMAALLFLLPALPGQWGPLAVYGAWLSAIWLAFAWFEGRPLIFTAAQATLTFSVLFGVTAWRISAPAWAALTGPFGLYAYGIGLALLGLAWSLFRLVTGKHEVALKLLDPPWPSLDRVVVGGLVFGQLCLAGFASWAGVDRELSISTSIAGDFPCGLTAYVLLAILSIDVGLTLPGRYRLPATGGIVVLAATLPVLISGSYSHGLSGASVLRWAQATTFLVGSLPLWIHRGQSHNKTPQRDLARWLLTALVAVPSVLLTVIAALAQVSAVQPAGPDTDSIFARMGWMASNVIPLLLVVLGLVGHGLRERSAGYTFAAGCVLNLAVAGGYAMSVVLVGHGFGTADCVRTFQWAIITASTWGLIWIASRSWTSAWDERRGRPMAKLLMSVQLDTAAAASMTILLVGLWLIAFMSQSSWTWAAEVGSPLGWLALFLTIFARFYRLHRAGASLPLYLIELVVSGIVGLTACSLAACQSQWSYLTLMLGWAALTPLLVAGAWALDRRPGRVLALASLTAESTAGSVRMLGLLVVVLGVKAAFLQPEFRLRSAVAMTLVGSAGAVMAVWRRRESWAFSSGLCVNFAASLVVWQLHDSIPFTQWTMLLVQANIIATAGIALLWLGARKHLCESVELTLRGAPLLALQVSLGITGNVLLLLTGPFLAILLQPSIQLAPELLSVGSPWGWLALVMTVVAAFRYAGQVLPRLQGHVLGGFGLAVGILAACTAGRHDGDGQWLSYHVLMGAWVGTGLLILAADSVVGLRGFDREGFSPFPWIVRFLRFPAEQFYQWLTGIGFLVLVLALRGAWEDPGRPYWPAGATLAVSVMAGGVALRLRSAWGVYVSGLLLNLAGTMVWIALGSSTAASFGYTQVLCLALGVAAWSALELLLAAASPPFTLQGCSVPFRHSGAISGLCLLWLLVAITVYGDVTQLLFFDGGLLSVAALLALGLAFCISLWDRTAAFAQGALYVLGLSALAIGVHVCEFEPRAYGWTAGPALALYVLVAALIAVSAPALGQFQRALRIPGRPASLSEPWFIFMEAGLTVCAVLLSVWISIDFSTTTERLAGPVAVAVLVPAAILLSSRWGHPLRIATLSLGAVVITEAAWALFVDSSLVVPWLHRSALTLVTFAIATVMVGMIFNRVLPTSSEWSHTCHRLGPTFGAIGSLVLVLILIQEAVLYDGANHGAPLALWAVWLVALTPLLLIAASIAFAVTPDHDPFSLSERRRTLHVYVAEILLGLIFIHLRLAVPELFRLGLFVKYWPFMVMAIAFAGVGLGEFFNRLKLPVLAQPLERTGIFLPLLPLLSFWVVPLVQSQPALLIDPAIYGKHASIWFLVGGLYSLVAIRRRSQGFALLAALTVNLGLWALLYHNRLDFFTHAQMWLIPLALIALVAEQINRDRLNDQQSAMLRYTALMVIYISSTADMFVAGLGESVVLPLTLAVLSILGILAGIAVRVRAFLYLGFTFLFLVIFSMIFHAAVGRHQPWIWWASLIVLGGCIIALFAVFEKRRDDLVRMLDKIKKWS
jgi:hypothetical protein